MNVVLINPNPIHRARISTDFDIEIDSIGRFPPVGLIALASYINAKSDHCVEILDCDAEQLEHGEAIKFLEEKDFDLVGLTSFSYTFYDVLELARALRRRFPDIPIVVGGPHTSLFARETLSHLEIDYLVNGEGERPFSYLLDKLQSGQLVEKVDGLSFRISTDKYHLGRAVYFDGLDKLPFPDYDLVKSNLYRSTIGPGGPTITLCTSRGCPFKCTFCRVIVKKYRSHSIDYIIGCVKKYYGRGYRFYYFFDDLFNITEKRVLDFCRALKREKLDIKWVFRGRTDVISEELCQLAAESGCLQFMLGVEDYTDKGLKLIKKEITMNQVRSAVQFAKKNGIQTSTNWIIGLPSHRSEDDLNELFKTAIKLGSDYAMFTILQLLPGCELFETAVREGIINRNAWMNFVKSPVPNYQIEFYDKYLTRELLEKYYKMSYIKYYRRPSYMFKSLLKIRSLKELRQKLSVGYKIISGG